MSKVEFLKSDEGEEGVPYPQAMEKMLRTLDDRLSEDGWGQPDRIFVVKISKLLDITGLSLEAIPYEIKDDLEFRTFAKHMFLVELDRYIDRSLGLDKAEGHDSSTPLDEFIGPEFMAMVLVQEEQVAAPARSITFLDLNRLTLGVRRGWADAQEDERVTFHRAKDMPEDAANGLSYLVMAGILAASYRQGVSASVRTLWENWLEESESDQTEG